MMMLKRKRIHCGTHLQQVRLGRLDFSHGCVCFFLVGEGGRGRERFAGSHWKAVPAQKGRLEGPDTLASEMKCYRRCSQVLRTVPSIILPAERADGRWRWWIHFKWVDSSLTDKRKGERELLATIVPLKQWLVRGIKCQQPALRHASLPNRAL